MTPDQKQEHQAEADLGRVLKGQVLAPAVVAPGELAVKEEQPHPLREVGLLGAPAPLLSPLQPHPRLGLIAGANRATRGKSGQQDFQGFRGEGLQAFLAFQGVEETPSRI